MTKMLNKGSFCSTSLVSSPSWQPCLSSQENVFKKFMLKNSAMCKVVPYYTTFVSGATLWDRGIYHPAVLPLWGRGKGSGAWGCVPLTGIGWFMLVTA
ncbi:unnamed protein product [Caretta caretta]